jgi:F-type H+-transporting ATPase subunit b
MRRLLLSICLPLVSTVSAFGAEHEGAAEPNKIWLWLNFLILVGALGWLIKKYAGPFFQSRSEEIRKGIEEAGKQKADAEARAAGIERRMASLATDIGDLRARATEEINAEGERVSRETEQKIAKVQVQAEQEIASAAKTARQELKAYAAELALELAERKIRARLTPAADARLLNEFVSDLDRRGRRGTN